MSTLNQVGGWHSRGYLPHFDGGCIPQMIKIRLGDALPGAVVGVWEEELLHLPPDRRKGQLRRKSEAYLDKGHGESWLGEPAIARLVEDALLHFDGERYQSHAWVVMPNHVHLLATPLPRRSLSSIAHSLKSFTSHEASRLLDRSGKLWQQDYFDTYVRHHQH